MAFWNRGRQPRDRDETPAPTPDPAADPGTDLAAGSAADPAPDEVPDAAAEPPPQPVELSTVPTVPDDPAESGSEVTVARGETLVEIGERVGVPAGRIAAHNGLADPRFIYPGQVLRVPAS